MMQFAWPWMLVFLPLPWLVARVVPAATPQAAPETALKWRLNEGIVVTPVGNERV